MPGINSKLPSRTVYYPISDNIEGNLSVPSCVPEWGDSLGSDAGEGGKPSYAFGDTSDATCWYKREVELGTPPNNNDVTITFGTNSFTWDCVRNGIGSNSYIAGARNFPVTGTTVIGPPCRPYPCKRTFAVKCDYSVSPAAGNSVYLALSVYSVNPDTGTNSFEVLDDVNVSGSGSGELRAQWEFGTEWGDTPRLIGITIEAEGTVAAGETDSGSFSNIRVVDLT